MTNIAEKKQAEIDANYRVFIEKLPELVKKYPDKFVVIHHKQFVRYCDTARDAMIHGTEAYPDGIFSIQEITQTAVDLGWFSHAPHYAVV